MRHKRVQLKQVKFVGPEGADSVGLPKRVYVKKGTRHERVVKAAPGSGSG